MRIQLRITANHKPVPFDHQAILTGALHKWLGENEEHNSISLYSFSSLTGGKLKQNQLDFSRGTSLTISAWDNRIIGKIIDGIRQDNHIAYGMRVREIILVETPDLSEQELFYLASPVFIKRTVGNRDVHIVYTEEDAGNYLKETLTNKLKTAGIEHVEFEIEFDKTYRKAKTKLITYRDIKNRASICPVIIRGDKIVKEFAWHVGIGNSTGIGFGALK
ncbi:MAG: CRISPR-associated endoribonuclease Cas6 [Marinifilaceae bacterium]